MPDDIKKSLQGNISGLFDLWSLEMSELAILSPEPSDGHDVYEYRWSIGEQSGRWCASVAQDTKRVARVVRIDADAKTGFYRKRTFEVDYPRLSDARQELQHRRVDLIGL